MFSFKSRSQPASTEIVISRNFSDRDNPAKYQVRPNDPNGHYVPQSVVIARDVSFINTAGDSRFDYEAGFACGVVAVGKPDYSVTHEDLAKLQPIEFNGSAFEAEIENRLVPVGSAKVLVLTDHGMAAVL